MGTDKTNTGRFWVTTVDIAGRVIFWDPLSALQYQQTDDHMFKSVGCCFNNSTFYANIQFHDGAKRINFNFRENSSWKSLSWKQTNHSSRDDKVFKFKGSKPRKLTLLPYDLLSKIDIFRKETEIEQDLMLFIRTFRSDYGLTCSNELFDADLRHLLSVKISQIESQKNRKAQSIGLQDFFEQGIKRCIPEGHTFNVLI